MNEIRSTRRSFLRASALAGAAPLILKSGTLARGASPNDKLNIAVIGVGGRGSRNLKDVAGENIVALCDVDENNLAAAAKLHPQAKTHIDWRKCLDQKGIDAVVCSTTDHSHAFVNVWAMNRGYHVYCEKPLANSVHEARVVRETYLKHKGKIATQMGTQMHATDNFRRIVELVRGGAIGTPKDVRVWCSRRPEGGSYLPAAGDPPSHLHWDLWLGPAQDRPFNPGYLNSCLNWNRFWDFGGGQIGDMGSHMMDMAYWALDLRFPTSCKAQGSERNPDTCPTWLVAEWEHPANDWRPAVKVHWYDGGKKPGMPSAIFARVDPDDAGDGSSRGNKADPLFKGMIINGDQGVLLADYAYRVIMPKGDMTHYKAPKPEDLIPPSPGQQAEWIRACKGGAPCLCDFDYSGAMIEHNFLALVAYRLGRPIQWDAQNLKATDCPEADQYIRRTYRKGWTLNG